MCVGGATDSTLITLSKWYICGGPTLKRTLMDKLGAVVRFLPFARQLYMSGQAATASTVDFRRVGSTADGAAGVGSYAQSTGKSTVVAHLNPFHLVALIKARVTATLDLRKIHVKGLNALVDDCVNGQNSAFNSAVEQLVAGKESTTAVADAGLALLQLNSDTEMVDVVPNSVDNAAAGEMKDEKRFNLLWTTKILLIWPTRGRSLRNQ